LEAESIKLTGSDISARDNASLAQAASAIAATFGELRGRGVIDDAELLRVVYRFAGELVDVPEMLGRGKAAGHDEGAKGSKGSKGISVAEDAGRQA
jgi:hypothetical protein